MGKPRRGGSRAGAAPPSRPSAKALGKAKPRFEAEDVDLSDEDDALKDPVLNKRDKVSLRLSDDEDDVDLGGDDAEGVFDLEDEDEEGDDGDEEDDEDEDDIEYALKRGGLMGQLARQAKALGQKLKVKQGDGDGEEEEENEEGGGAAGGKDDGGLRRDDRLWGANKRSYYDDDAAEADDDDELAKEEEAEALRLQRQRLAKLAPGDFGLDDDDDDEGEEDDEGDDESDEVEETMEALAAQKKKHKGSKDAGAKGGVRVESVAVDLAAVGHDARMSALLSDAPELLTLLQDLTDSLAEVRHRVGPLLSELRDGGLATAEGLSYLEAKHLLLLSYCLHIVFYLLLKAEGRSVRDHPVIARLVELRAYLEKIRPIDKQLQYQVDKLLKAATLATAAGRRAGGDDDDEAAGIGPSSAAAGGGAAHDDDAMTRYGPRPDALVAKAGGGAGGGGGMAAGGEAPSGGVYRPPKINPVSMELDEQQPPGGGALTAREQRRLTELKAKSRRSDTLRALAAELTGAPEEEDAAVAGFDSMAALKTRQRLEARASAEEDMFMRVPLSKDEAKRLRQQRRAGLSGAGLMEDFGDEVADLVGMASGGGGGTLNELFAKQKVSQRFGVDHPSLTARRHGGDEDLPTREPLNQRRAKFDSAAAKRAARQDLGSDDFDGGAEEYDLGGTDKAKKAKRRGEEDDFYREAKESAGMRKKARAEAHRAPGLAPPLPDPTAGAGSRPISDEIQRNRGLTPHRRRDQKNPRKKNRMKFEKALVRVKGAVQAVRAPEAVAYGGEATGIKSKISKSRRLG